MGKVGPTIGEHLSSSTKVALDEQKREEMRLLILRGLAAAATSEQSRPLGGERKKKKLALCSLSLLIPDPHAANSETPSPKNPPPPPLNSPAAFFGLAGLCVFAQPRLFNHRARDSIPSFAADWKLQEEVRLRSMEREGAPGTSVVCDPVRRGA